MTTLVAPWPRTGARVLRPPQPNPHSSGLVRPAAPDAAARIAAGLPLITPNPREIVVLDTTPFADCVAATEVTLYGWNPFTGAAYPYVIGFNSGAGRAVNFWNAAGQGSATWAVNQTEAQARALIVSTINAAFTLWENSPGHFPFKAYQIPDFAVEGSTHLTAIAIERVWPLNGGGNDTPIVSGVLSATSLHPIRLAGSLFVKGSTGLNLLPARVGPMPALIPFDLPPDAQGATGPAGGNTPQLG